MDDTDTLSASVYSPTSDKEQMITCSNNQLTVAQEFIRKQQKMKEKLHNIPEKYRGFESLLYTEGDNEYDGPPIPTGDYHYSTHYIYYTMYSIDTHRCVQALKVALHHPLAITDAKEASYKSVTAKTEVGNYLKQAVSHAKIQIIQLVF